MPDAETLLPEVRERFPDFRPDDPATWPEPDRCTDRAPFGPGDSVRWVSYLHELARADAGQKVYVGRCRNRARTDHLCGVHDNARTRAKVAAERADALRARKQAAGRIVGHLTDQLGPYGIALDVRSSGRVIGMDTGSAQRLAELLDAAALRLGHPILPSDLID
jgi:hypothetical protein